MQGSIHWHSWQQIVTGASEEPEGADCRFSGMGKKYEYASSAEACERMGRAGASDHDAIEWFGLAMYWTVLSRCTRPEDQEDHFIAKVDTLGTGQVSSATFH